MELHAADPEYLLSACRVGHILSPKKTPLAFSSLLARSTQLNGCVYRCRGLGLGFVIFRQSGFHHGLLMGQWMGQRFPGLIVLTTFMHLDMWENSVLQPSVQHDYLAVPCNLKGP